MVGKALCYGKARLWDMQEVRLDGCRIIHSEKEVGGGVAMSDDVTWLN
jgi:hypothetical protein